MVMWRELLRLWPQGLSRQHFKQGAQKDWLGKRFEMNISWVSTLVLMSGSCFWLTFYKHLHRRCLWRNAQYRRRASANVPLRHAKDIVVFALKSRTRWAQERLTASHFDFRIAICDILSEWSNGDPLRSRFSFFGVAIRRFGVYLVSIGFSDVLFLSCVSDAICSMLSVLLSQRLSAAE